MANNKHFSNSKDIKKADEKKEAIFSWPSIAVMTFCTLWGFGNLINGCFYFGQTKVIGVWLLVFLLYFLPYSLMVGELGSVFRDKGGGVSSWIYETIGHKAAFFCGWIGWVVILPYLSRSPSMIIIAFNWAVNQNGDISYIDPKLMQFIGLGIFLVAVFLASRGLKVIKIISSVAGTASFIMSLLFIVFGFLGAAINVDPVNLKTYPIDFSPQNFFPSDLSVFASLSILIFGVGGAEKVAPYVNRMEKPGRDFPKGIIAVVIMVASVALLGAFAMSVTFGQQGQEIGSDFLTNGAYMAFYKVGCELGLGVVPVVIYSSMEVTANFAVLIISIDVPLRLLLGNADTRFIPKNTLKKNKYGAYPIWLGIVTIVVTILLIVPVFGIGETDALVKWLIEINSICTPLFYVCVFIAYIGFKACKKKIKRHEDDFTFIKNKTLGIIIGAWCSILTLAALIMQIYEENIFLFILNLCIPLILLGLGVILPFFAQRYNRKHGITNS